jgi:chromatin assembly factor 1 subunit A
VELRNGKVYFKQKPLSFEKQSETLQGLFGVYSYGSQGSFSNSEIVKFRDMLEERISKQEPPFASFPNEHKPLVAKLAHERSVLSVMLLVASKSH